MKIIGALFLVLVFFSSVALGSPSHFCDDDSYYTTADCVYLYEDDDDGNLATTADACLVYKSTNFCIRCMEESYLTPTVKGQYCSYFIKKEAVAGDADARRLQSKEPQNLNHTSRLLDSNTNTQGRRLQGSTEDGQECYLSYYDSKNGLAPSGYYYTRTIYNTSSTDKVTYCLDPLLVVQYPDLCEDFGEPSQINDAIVNWYAQSIGCFECSTATEYKSVDVVIVPRMEYDYALGIVVNDCLFSSEETYDEICKFTKAYDSDSADCEYCTDTLPMCLQCSDPLTCTQCFAGYRPVALEDAYGVAYTACLLDFCGYDTEEYHGFTHDCLTCDDLEACLQCQVLEGYSDADGFSQDQSCQVCQFGFYLEETVLANGSVYYCVERAEASVAQDLFVFSTDGELQPTGSQEGDGMTFETAYQFLALAINDVYLGRSLNVQKYDEVTYTIWVGKGVHHWFFCPEDADTSITTVCDDPYLKFAYPLTNNVNLEVKALDCYERNYYFRDLSGYGSAALFDDNCVDVRRDEKPQIRVTSNYTFFNVTNTATFENLEFTGVDMLAVQTDLYDEDGELDPDAVQCDFTFIPLKKCEFSKDPPGSVVQELDIVTMSAFECDFACLVDGYAPEYEGYDPERMLNFTISNGECVANKTGMAGTTACSGVPYHKEYLSANTNGVFTKRHAVLFNLYAFDGLTSETIITPTLNLINCDFKYFLAGSEALINIETDNIIATSGHDRVTQGTNSEAYIEFYGTDTGAVILIQYCTFKDSKFCKGLIVYREQQGFSAIDDSSLHVNRTNYGAVYPTTEPSLRIEDSTFQNLGFTDQIRMISLPTSVTETGMLVHDLLWYDIFFNKGLVLNMKGWKGDITIQDSDFKENMHNIPGLAYVEESVDAVKLQRSSIRSEENYYQNYQLYCWGSLLPQINLETELYGLTESFNLIHLTDMADYSVKISTSSFENNIAFDGNIYLDNVASLSITSTRFKKNMSYTQANAVQVHNVVTASIEDSQFYENQGWQHTKGGAVAFINSETITVSNSKFSQNSAGHHGSALHFSLCVDVTIQQNDFIENGPTYSTLEQVSNSPYFYFLQNKKRTSVYYDDSGVCENEFSYFQSCKTDNYLIPMSYSEGAIYIAAADSTDEDSTVASAIIVQNFFYNNQAMPIFDTSSQSSSQASCLMIQGNTATKITKNDFRSHKSNFGVQIKDDARVLYYAQTSTNYWEYSHAPLIKMETSEVSMTDNIFTDNFNWQVNMQGSLMQFMSTVKSTASADDFYVNTSSGSSLEIEEEEDDQSRTAFNQEEEKKSDKDEKDLKDTSDKTTFSTKNTDKTATTDSTSSTTAPADSPTAPADSPTAPVDSPTAPADSSSSGGKSGGKRRRLGTSRYLLGSELADLYTSKVLFQNNDIFENSFNSFSSDSGGMIYITDSVAIVMENRFTSNGNFDYGLPIVSVSNGLAIIEGNTFSHLYCKDTCVAQVDSAAAQIQNNTMSFIVGGAFTLSQSSLILQDQISNNTFEAIVTMKSQSTAEIYRCQFFNSWGELGSVLNLEDSSFIMAYTVMRRTLDTGNNRELLTETYAGIRPIKYFITNTGLNYVNNVVSSNGQIYISNGKVESTITNCDFINLMGDEVAILTSYNSKVLIEFKDEFDTVVTEEQANTDTEDSEVSRRRKSDRALLRQLQDSDISFVQEEQGEQTADALLQNYVEVKQKGFSQNQALNGVIFELHNSELVLKNATITGSIVTESLILATSSKVEISGSTFINNDAGKFGAMNFVNCLQISINNTLIQNNTGSLSSAFTVVSSDLEFQDLQILDNQAGEVTISATYSTLQFNNTVFDGNIGNLVSNGFQMINSQVILKNSLIQNSNNAKTQTGFFNMMLQSDLQILDNSQIRNISAQINGLILAATESNITIANNVSITDCSSYLATISAVNSPNFTIANDVYMAGHDPGILTALQSTVHMSNAVFTETTAQIFYAYESTLFLKNISMHDSSGSKNDGHGLQCESCKYVSIDNCTFQNLTSKDGGALNIQALEVSIVNTLFIDNKAETGGALRLEEPGNTTIENCTFVNNAAQIDGGAILYNCHNDTESSCYVNLIGTNFTQNSAVQKGGALQYYSMNFTEVISTLFTNNTAVYGADLGSYPLNLVFENAAGTWSIDTVAFSEQSTPVQLVPGHLIQLYITIYDQEGRQYEAESQAIARFAFNNDDNAKGYYINGKQAVATRGLFTFENLQMQMEPETVSHVVFRLQNLENYDNPISFITGELVLEVNAQKCYRGEHFTDALMCVACNAGYYLLDVSDSDQACLECRAEAYCFGGSNTVPRPGYWRETNTTDTYFSCANPDACLGGTSDQPLTICESGYGGIQCSICQKEYQKKGYFRCQACYSVGWEVFLYVINLALLLLVIFMLIRGQIVHLLVTQPRLMVYYKIMISNIQIMGMISQIDFDWGDTTKTLLWIWEVISRGPLNAIAPDCLFQQLFGYTNEEGSDKRLLYTNIIMSSVIPLIALTIAIVYWVIYGFVKNQIKDIQDYLLATIVIIMFLYTPTIMEFVFQAMNCQNVIYDGPRLFIDMHEMCFQGTHLIVFIVLTIPSLVLWCYVAPVLVNNQLNRNAALLNQIKMGEVTRFDQQQIRTLRLRLSFVTAGFQLSEYNWQILLEYKKILVVFLVVFGSATTQGATTQSLLLILFLVIMLAAQLYIQPYYTSHLNQMEIVCSFIQIETLFIGLFYTKQPDVQSSNSDYSTLVAFSILGVSYLAMCIVFYLRLRIEILKWLIENDWNGRVVYFIRTLCFGIVNVQQFRQKYMNGGAAGTDETGDFKGLEMEAKNKTNDKKQKRNLEGFDSLYNSHDMIAISSSSFIQDEHTVDVTATVHSDRTVSQPNMVTPKSSGRKKGLLLGIPGDDDKPTELKSALELLPSDRQEKGKPINQGKLLNPSGQQNKPEIVKKLNLNGIIAQQAVLPKREEPQFTESDAGYDMTQRTDDDFQLKNSVTTQHTGFTNDQKLYKESISKFSHSAAPSISSQFLAQRQRPQSQAPHAVQAPITDRSPRAGLTDRSGASTFRQHQNFSYKDELEFKGEKEESKRGQKSSRFRKNQESSDESDELDEDPFGMLSKRAKIKRQRQKAQQVAKSQQIPIPAPKQSQIKSQFEATFAKHKNGGKLNNNTFGTQQSDDSSGSSSNDVSDNSADKITHIQNKVVGSNQRHQLTTVVQETDDVMHLQSGSRQMTSQAQPPRNDDRFSSQEQMEVAIRNRAQQKKQKSQQVNAVNDTEANQPRESVQINSKQEQSSMESSSGGHSNSSGDNDDDDEESKSDIQIVEKRVAKNPQPRPQTATAQNQRPLPSNSSSQMMQQRPNQIRANNLISSQKHISLGQAHAARPVAVAVSNGTTLQVDDISNNTAHVLHFSSSDDDEARVKD